jgi:hypothetical protein
MLKQARIQASVTSYPKAKRIKEISFLSDKYEIYDSLGDIGFMKGLDGAV